MFRKFFGHPDAKLTVGQFLPQYFQYADLRGSSRKRYICEVGRFDRVAGNPPMGRIDTDTFTAFRQSCRTLNLANSSIESTIKIVRVVLRYAHDRGILKALPTFGKPLKQVRPSPTPATIDELDKLYRVCDQTAVNGRGVVSPCDWWRSWLVIGYFTGLRFTDLSYRLGWDHIKSDHIEFRAEKTGSKHLFPLCDPVQRAIDTMARAQHSEVIFGGIMPTHMNEEIKRLSSIAGIRPFGAQIMRQTSITSWMTASETAGKLIHGCGLPHILDHYVGVLRVLEEALPRFPWPAAMTEWGGR